MRFIDKGYKEKKEILWNFYNKNKKAKETIKYLIDTNTINNEHIVGDEFDFLEKLFIDGYAAYRNKIYVDPFDLVLTENNNWILSGEIIPYDEIDYYIFSDGGSILQEIMLDPELNKNKIQQLFFNRQVEYKNNKIFFDKNYGRMKKIERLI